jgi:hypothetical protein
MATREGCANVGVEGGTAETAASGVMGTVKEKVKNVAAGASEIAGMATETAKEWASSVGDAAVDTKEKAQELLSTAADKAGQAGDELTHMIRRYPLQSLLLGCAVGFLAAQVFRRS